MSWKGTGFAARSLTLYTPKKKSIPRGNDLRREDRVAVTMSTHDDGKPPKAINRGGTRPLTANYTLAGDQPSRNSSQQCTVVHAPSRSRSRDDIAPRLQTSSVDTPRLAAWDGCEALSRPSGANQRGCQLTSATRSRARKCRARPSPRASTPPRAGAGASDRSSGATCSSRR